MLMAASAMATETRTMVMGDNDMIIVDDGNIFRFPGRTVNYPNLAVGEFDVSNDFSKFGINWQFGDESPFVVGTYFSTMGPVVPAWTDGSAMFSWDGPFAQNRRIQLVGGKGLDLFNMGWKIELAKSSWEVEATETDSTSTSRDVNLSKESLREIVFGFGLTEAATGKWDVALNILFGTWTNEDVAGNAEYKPDGYSDIWLEGRYFLVRSPKITLVPHIMVGKGKRGLEQYNEWYELDTSGNPGGDPTTLDLTATHKSTMFDLGIGMNYTSGPNLLAVCDFGIMYTKVDDEGDYSTVMETDSLVYVGEIGDDWDNSDKGWVFPYFKIGMEAQVFKWMDIRMGATSYWVSDTQDEAMTSSRLTGPGAYPSTTSTTKRSFANNETYLGFGFNWNRLYIDTYTDPQLVLDGFNFISGSTDARNMNWRVSVLYEMF
jgi:hypothetical protein